MSQWPKKQPWHDGVRMQFDYEDYIMSVVRFTGSYGYKNNLWEVAFMDRETRDFVKPPISILDEEMFTSKFSNDVGIYGHLNDPQVDALHIAMEQLSKYYE